MNDLHVAARRELDDEIAFLESERPGAGLRFLDAFLEAVDLLRRYPRAGRKIGRRMHKFTMRGAPFSIVYTIESFGVFIVAIAHQSRKPRYWAGRLRE